MYFCILELLTENSLLHFRIMDVKNNFDDKNPDCASISPAEKPCDEYPAEKPCDEYFDHAYASPKKSTSPAKRPCDQFVEHAYASPPKRQRNNIACRKWREKNKSRKLFVARKDYMILMKLKYCHMIWDK